MTGPVYLAHLRNEWRGLRHLPADQRAEQTRAIEDEAAAIKALADGGLNPEVIEVPRPN